jgi:hypothetical protein
MYSRKTGKCLLGAQGNVYWVAINCPEKRVREAGEVSTGTSVASMELEPLPQGTWVDTGLQNSAQAN